MRSHRFHTTVARQALLLLAMLFLLFVPHARTAEKDRVDLLRLPAAKLERSSVPGSELASFKLLIDDKPETIVNGTASADAPLEVVFGFGGAVVTPERLVVRVSAKDPAAKVEVRASTVSGDAGFQFVRADPIKATMEPQTFTLPSVAARWVMLSFTPAVKATRLAIAEISLQGRQGPPVSHYEFTESPAKAIDVLARLKKLSRLSVDITADEANLFEDAQDGKLDKWSFGEAALLASGITDATKRKPYLERLDKIAAEAEKAVAGAKTPLEKGEKLLRFLHAGPQAKGYKSRQTDLSVVLDTGTYNCVSSAVLYNVIGRRLGLDLRGIEVPDHAFAILYSGNSHADVETTTAGGFNPSRDAAAQKEFEAQTGFRYIPDSYRDQRREIGETGMTAIICYNHGVDLTRDKRHHEALLAYFRAMSLDPEFASAVKNALAVLANWSLSLAEEGKFDDAMLVFETGLDLAPKDATLLHNRKVVWGNWAKSKLKAGQPDGAVALLREAAKKVPTEAGYFLSLQSGLFIGQGEELVRQKQWAKALEVVEPAFAKIDKGAQEDLAKWQAAVWGRWAHVETEQGNHAQAVELVAEGRGKFPADKRFASNLAWTIQQWAKDVHAKKGEDEAMALLAKQLKRFPNVAEVRDVASNHVHRLLSGLRDAGKYDEALTTLERHDAFLKEVLKDKGAKEIKDLARAVYDGWAKKRVAVKDYAGALEVYDKALKRLPGDTHLKNNLEYTIQEWSKDVLDQGNETKAREVILAQLARFPDSRGVIDVAESHTYRAVRKLSDAGKYEEALAAIDRHKELLKAAFKDKADAKLGELGADVYDGWARKMPDRGQALGVYQQGLKRLPANHKLKNNLIYSAQEGTREIYGQLGEVKAKEFLRTQLTRLADVADLGEVAEGYVHWLARKHCDAGKFEEGLAATDRHKDLFKDPKGAVSAAHRVYDAWADTFLKRKPNNWQGAIDIYAKGLRQYPKDSHLENNAVATWDRWAKTYFETKDWKEAIGVYEKAFVQFPGNYTLKNNLEYCRKQMK